MRRIVIWLASTVTVLVLLFGYHTSTDSSSPPASTPSAATAPVPSASSTGSTAPSPSASASPSASPSKTPQAPKSYTGSIVDTRWGPVQVKITVSAGKVTTVDVVQHPSGNGKDQEINDYALPVLVQETVDAQSAQIDMVSGATVTSTGYVQSLQSALDKAGL